MPIVRLRGQNVPIHVDERWALAWRRDFNRLSESIWLKPPVTALGVFHFWGEYVTLSEVRAKSP
jgi:hypothetical protein